MSTRHISIGVPRRFLLGRQGLWPGRRWSGKQGAAQAIHNLESGQVDPMTVVARGHDLVLWSRVDGYEPWQLDELLYADGRFLDDRGLNPFATGGTDLRNTFPSRRDYTMQDSLPR